MNTYLTSKNVRATAENPWARWFGRTVLLGVVVNMFFVVACFFFPRPMCELLHLKVPDPIIWAAAALVHPCIALVHELNEAAGELYGDRVTLFYYLMRRPLAAARQFLGL